MPTTAPTTLPLTPAEVRQGMYFAVCLAVMVPSACLFPLLCTAALRIRRPAITVGALATGVAGITAAFLLSGPIPGIVPVVGLFYVLALAGVVIYGLVRRRWPPRPAGGRRPRAAAGTVAGNGDATRRLAGAGNGANGAKGNGAVDNPDHPDRRRRLGG